VTCRFMSVFMNLITLQIRQCRKSEITLLMFNYIFASSNKRNMFQIKVEDLMWPLFNIMHQGFMTKLS